MKKLLSFILVFCMLLTFPAAVQAEETHVSVVLNGVLLEFDVPPQIIEGRTMVPVRKIFESLGALVEWNGETRTVTATTKERVVIMQIDNNVITVNNEEIVLDVPPQIVAGRTLVPVRAASEGLGALVEWEDSTKTVIITVQDEFAPLEERLKNTTKTRLGDAFYNWSIDIPKGVPLSVLAPDGVYFEFSDEYMNEIVSLNVATANNATIEAIKQFELDYVYDNSLTLISQTVEKTTDGVEYVRTVYEYNYYTSRFHGDSRMFLKDGYVYSLYTRCYANEEDIEYYKSIEDSFKFEYDKSLCEPLQKIENGMRWYYSEKYHVGFYVPAGWKYLNANNQVVFLSGEVENATSLGMIGFSVFSVTEGESVEEYAQKSKAAYLKMYEYYKDTLTQSELKEVTINGNTGVYYTDRISSSDLESYHHDMFFYLGDYIYNFSLSFINTDSSVAEAAINSFTAETPAENEFGYLTPHPAG